MRDRADWKTTFDVQVDDVLTICTPGGGGFLPKEDSDVGFSLELPLFPLNVVLFPGMELPLAHL